MVVSLRGLLTIGAYPYSGVGYSIDLKNKIRV
jgi:hypothetical protein